MGIFITHLAEFEAEIAAHKGQPLPTFGIEPREQLSEAAQKVAPGAGLAATVNGPKEEISFSRKQLAAVYELVQALNGVGDRGELMSVFTEKLSSMVSFDTCALTIFARDTGQTFVEHAAGQHSEIIKGRQVTPGEGITGWVIANLEPFSSTDPCLDFPVETAESFKSYRSLASFPLMKDAEIYGALTVYSMAFAEYDKDQQKLLGESAAVLADALSSMSRVPEVTNVDAEPIATEFIADSLPEVDVTSLDSSFTH